jgi:hypothetical protein
MILTRLLPRDMRYGGEFALEDGFEREAKQEYHAQVQAFAKRTVAPEEYHVRGMLLCNSARDYYYSRFSVEALDEIAELTPGAPVMAAHDYRTLPQGVFVAAQRTAIPRPNVPRRDSNWVKCLYAIPADDIGNAITRRIDLGIQREVSIGWRCVGADCSECHEPIWMCRHVPGDVYKGGICEFEFSGITAVLEGSHVYRGGQKDTATFVPDGAVAGAAELPVDGAAGIKANSRPDPFAARRGAQLLWSDVGGFKRGVAAGERWAGFGEVEFGLRGNVHALVMSRERFDTRAAAARWVRDHDWRADRCRETETDFVFDQFAPHDGAKLRSQRLDPGVAASIAMPDAPDPERVAPAPMTLEEWLQKT